MIFLIIILCSGMFRNVPCSWFYPRPEIQSMNNECLGLKCKINKKMAASVLSGVLRRFSCTIVRPIRSFHKPWRVSVLTRLKSSSTEPSSVENAKEQNWKCRQDLATAFRGLHWYGLGEGVCTHLTMMAPALSGDGEVMLMIPHGLHWSQVCNTFHF